MAASFTVERSTTIDAPPAAVYERIVDFHRWSAWSPFEELDPEMRRTFEGPASGPGSIYHWSGNMKAGAGLMEMVEAVPGQKVVIDQRNFKPTKSRAEVTFSLAPVGEGTSVTWSMVGRSTTTTKLMGIFRSMDRMIGPVFEKGLANLKADSEGA
ncbi:MAG TPA: SRPBCC family protein [Solirubrobacterales bacterium]|nr:SRPBCC family protein [Solirubrobacterales bacterium]